LAISHVFFSALDNPPRKLTSSSIRLEDLDQAHTRSAADSANNRGVPPDHTKPIQSHWH
jgi:hypothetical protein